MKLLEIGGGVARCGGGDVLKGIDISVDAGEIVPLLGSNGAGKSTTLRAISGLVPQITGSIKLDGRSILGLKPEAIVRLGISHVPEGRRVFPGLTVRENIMLGASNRKGLSRRQLEAEVDEQLGFFSDLQRLQHALGLTLSRGQLQMVAGARRPHQGAAPPGRAFTSERWPTAKGAEEMFRHLLSPLCRRPHLSLRNAGPGAARPWRVQGRALALPSFQRLPARRGGQYSSISVVEM